MSSTGDNKKKNDDKDKQDDKDNKDDKVKTYFWTRKWLSAGEALTILTTWGYTRRCT